MKKITIDCAGLSDKDALHAAFAEALQFPDWYGRNLDALHDLLTEIGEETALELLNWDKAEDEMPVYARLTRRTILHAAEDNPGLTVNFM